MREWLKQNMANPVAVCGAIFLISALSLMAALTAQYVYGLQPCVLCVYQRWPYGIVMVLSMFGLATLYKEEWARFASLLVFICSLVFFVGGAIAFYHVGVEQHWWASAVEGCAVDFEARDVDELMALMDNKPSVRCDEVAWADPFFGISMAGYNMLLSFMLAIGSALSAILMQRKVNGVL